MKTGTTEDGQPFHERYINAAQVLVQRNRQGAWHGYVSQMIRQSFSTEQQAIEWLSNFPLSELS